MHVFFSQPGKVAAASPASYWFCKPLCFGKSNPAGLSDIMNEVLPDYTPILND
jgi:hypothetical protein